MEEFDDFNDEEDTEIDLTECEEVEEIADGMLENIEYSETDNVIDHAIVTFTGHSNSVFTGDVSGDGTWAITGGQDDMAYVWSTSDGRTLYECTGHKDSVSEVKISFDGQYIATGDLSGLVQVWSSEEKKLVWCSEDDDLEWLVWHPFANVLLAGNHSGIIYVWQIPQGNCKILATHGSAALCGKILPNGKQLIAGYEDGQLKLWDIKTTTPVWLMKTSEAGIINLDVNEDATLVSVAPSAHLVKLSDGKILNQLLSANEKEIEMALFNDKLGVLVTASLTGVVCIWDSRKYTLRHQLEIDSSVTVIKFAPEEKLLAGTSDGFINVYNVKSGHFVRSFTGHRSEILSLTLSKDGKFILSTSDDFTAKIFDLSC